MQKMEMTFSTCSTVPVFITKHRQVMQITTYADSTQLYITTLIHKEIQIKF
jgi:hypothetical protein